MPCCGADLCYDRLVLEYLNFTTNLRKCYLPVEGPMVPQNMPGFFGPRIHQAPVGSTDDIAAYTIDVVDPYCASILSSIFI